jgi:hypothetical protein
MPQLAKYLFGSAFILPKYAVRYLKDKFCDKIIYRSTKYNNKSQAKWETAFRILNSCLRLRLLMGKLSLRSSLIILLKQ